MKDAEGTKRRKLQGKRYSDHNGIVFVMKPGSGKAKEGSR
jgi:hypothetical protein